MSHSIQLKQKPSILSLYSRALFAKGQGKKNIELPKIDATLNGVSIDKEKVKEYALICGFPENSSKLPMPYPHMLAFPLHLEIMLHKAFPLALLGLVHIRNEITQHRSIGIDETLDIHCYLSGSEKTDKGLEFDIKTEVHCHGNLVWESISTNLARMRSENKEQKPKEQNPQLPTMDNCEKWMLTTDLGRRYAAVSGDSNPIHLHPLSAKLFGFKGHIAHGMWTKARAIAALMPKVSSEHVSVFVAFKLPIFLPTNVELNYSVDDKGVEFDVRDKTGEKPHMAGQIKVHS